MNGTAPPFSQAPLNSPLATKSSSATPQQILDSFGRVAPSINDPAWQPPRDPLEAGNPRDAARVINREIPVVTVQTGWAIADVRRAIEDLVIGLFDQPAQLVDAVMGDSRVQSAMASRTGGLLGRPLSFKIPPKYKDDSRAQECLDAWQRMWPSMAPEPVLSDLQMWGTQLGFGTAQLLWDTSEGIWTPYIQPWHPRYTYYHWIFRRFVAITLDGQVPIEPGDAHWVLHAPYGMYRGWMRGAMRAVAPWWLARNYALRDWARYSERHGMPILKAITPAGADKDVIVQFRNDMASLGQESVVQLPQSVDPIIGKYDLEALEFSDAGWDGFRGLIEQCNTEITLALLGQNLTSEVKEGSFAAARVHADVRQTLLEADARSLSQTVYMQIARPFAAINFGDPELAPRTEWDVSPEEDHKVTADTFASFANAIGILRKVGKDVTDVVELAKKFGLHLSQGDLKDADPLAGATGEGMR